MSEQLRQQRASLRLVSCCEECEHFVGDEVSGASGSAGGQCDLLYPTAPHRRAAWDQAKDGDEISFCKMFEAR